MVGIEWGHGSKAQGPTPAHYDCGRATTIEVPGLSLTNELAKGGQAAVWKAKEIPDPQRDVAVKLVECDPEKCREGDPSLEEVFREEARTWAEFQKSPYVVQLYYSFRDLFTTERRDRLALGFVMEYSPEGDLSKHLKAGEFDLGGKKQTRNFLLNIASAVKAGHDKDIVHGDIKARNVILFRQSGTLGPKLMDFGMAISTDTSRTRWGGTPEYMAPELFPGNKPTKESDVYSLGILFYEIICGDLPYLLPARDRAAKWRDYEQIHKNGNANFDAVRARFDTHLTELIRGMMHCDPARRTKLSRVISLLRRHQDDEIRATAKDPERDALVRPRTYRWNPKVHELLGNHLFYFFIKGISPSGDPKWFKNNLFERGVHGYSLYRVLGGFDYVLRVWLKHPYEEEVDLLVRNFRDAHGGSFVRFAARNMELFSQAVRPLCSTVADDMLPAIYECRAANSDTEFEKLQARGLVCSRFAANEELPIRFFLTVYAGNRSTDFLLRSYAREFAEAMKRDGTAQRISVYQGEGDFNGRTTALSKMSERPLFMWL